MELDILFQGFGVTFHASWETFKNSFVHVNRRNPVTQFSGNTVTWSRNSIAFAVGADERAFLDARYVRWIRSSKPTKSTIYITLIMYIENSLSTNYGVFIRILRA